MLDSRFENHPDEAVMRRAAMRGPRSSVWQELDAHLSMCESCAAELEARVAFRAAMAGDAADEASDRQAVDRALAHLTDADIREGMASGWRDAALDRAAVEGAMARLSGVGLRDAIRSGSRRTALVFAAGAAAAAVLAFVAFRPTAPTPAPHTIATSREAPRLMVLTDGSEVAPESATTGVAIKEETPVITTVELPRGAARFRVRHDDRRLFRVQAGPFQIEDLGTTFRISHESDGRVRVAVTEGRVAVMGAGQRRVELGAGEERLFTPIAERIFEAPALEPAKVSEPTRPSSRALARGHRSEDPNGLLSAADFARRAGAPGDAVAPLRRLVERYPKDPRAPAAAFTLGWVLLTDLNRPREAAAAFAEAERSAPRGALAEDAAARVAEAWQNAGQPRRAAVAARHYAQTYPSGRYIVLMRGLIGEN